jgi:hypothetical protein
MILLLLKNNEWVIVKAREKIWQRVSFDGSDFFINLLRVGIAAFI